MKEGEKEPVVDNVTGEQKKLIEGMSNQIGHVAKNLLERFARGDASREDIIAALGDQVDAVCNTLEGMREK